jgi:hypothetical protein
LPHDIDDSTARQRAKRDTAVRSWWRALSVSLLGVLSGDLALYWVGCHWGEHVLNWRVVRLVLLPARELWLKAAYRRHALKTVVTARHVMGLRAAVMKQPTTSDNGYRCSLVVEDNTQEGAEHPVAVSVLA